MRERRRDCKRPAIRPRAVLGNLLFTQSMLGSAPAPIQPRSAGDIGGGVDVGVMGKAGGLAVGQLARVCARVALAVAACSMLAACAGSNLSSKSRYSKRIIQDGEPVPKGGGTYKVGQPYRLNGKTYYPDENPNYRQEGIASWYGPDFHGRETANGEVYDMHGISAAHTTMPIPSYARVTNLENGRSIIVRVNDRGPYVNDRIIDLSIGAAKALDTYSKGLGRVRVEYVGKAPLEGSDDKMLLATLSHGRPAQPPSLVMVASAKPFVPGSGTTDSPVVGRSPNGGPATARAAASPAETAGRRPVMRASEPAPATTAADSRLAAPSSGIGPSQGLVPSQGLGLMSGRGLY
jgi:rare lipoprotein A